MRRATVVTGCVKIIMSRRNNNIIKIIIYDITISNKKNNK